MLSFIPHRTITLVFGNQIDTSGVVLTLVVYAFVDVHGTIISGITGLAVALVSFSVVYAGTIVKTIGIIT